MTKNLYQSKNIPEFIRPLADDMRQFLHDECVALGLSEVAYEQLDGITCYLRDFEAYGKDKLKSEQQKIKDLEALEAAAKALTRAIFELDNFQCLGLSNALPPEGLKHIHKTHISFPGVSLEVGREVVACGLDYPMKGFRVGYIATEAQRLAAAAHKFINLKFEKSSPSTGGRIKTNPHYAWHIGQILDAVETDYDRTTPIKLGRGGKFEKLCCVVFTAAGVAISPEGPLREFIRNRNADANTPDDLPF